MIIIDDNHYFNFGWFNIVNRWTWLFQSIDPFVSFILTPNYSICPNSFVLANLMFSHLRNFIYYRCIKPVNFITVGPSLFPRIFCWEHSRVDDKWIVQIRHDSPSLYMKYLVDFASLRKNFEKSNKQFFWRIGKFPKIGWKIAKLFLFQIIFSVKKLKNQVHFPSISISSRSTLKKISLFSPIFANIGSNSIL